MESGTVTPVVCAQTWTMRALFRSASAALSDTPLGAAITAPSNPDTVKVSKPFG